MIDGYLRRLGLAAQAPPSAAALVALHRAHVERVPYETVEIHLGRPTTVDPHQAVDRVLAGRGGYCFHLNGAFGVLLDALGYRVDRHSGGVTGWEATAPSPIGNHLALTVHGLPTAANPAGSWFVDVGLGDALHEPLPLTAGEYHQPPFRYRLGPSDLVPGGWRFDHDPSGAFARMDFAPDPAVPADFAATHRWLSSDPASPFVQVFTAQRRYGDGVDMLRGCVLVSVTAAGRSTHVLDSPAAWFDTLANRFGLTLDDLSGAQRTALWQRVHAAHLQWGALRRPGTG